jgi:ParB/RepB/Spo0J family partition protein
VDAGRSVEEHADELQIDIRSIPIADIDLTPGNPNFVDEETMEALGREIDRGFVQPILVRPNGDRWTCVDGEHRLKIVAERGFRTIPAVVEPIDDVEGRVRLLTMNRLRGQFVPIQLAHFLVNLSQEVPEDELRKRLGMEAGEFRDTLRLANLTDPVAEAVRTAREREEADAPVVLHFALRPRDAEAIERALAPMVNGDVDRGRALAKICREYTPTAKPKRAPRGK